MTKKDETTENGPILKDLTDQEATALCAELREELVRDVSRTGGHLASNLGAVELTVAIHRVFDTSRDRLVFDVGHQCYLPQDAHRTPGGDVYPAAVWRHCRIPEAK